MTKKKDTAETQDETQDEAPQEGVQDETQGEAPQDETQGEAPQEGVQEVTCYLAHDADCAGQNDCSCGAGQTILDLLGNFVYDPHAVDAAHLSACEAASDSVNAHAVQEAGGRVPYILVAVLTAMNRDLCNAAVEQHKAYDAKKKAEGTRVGETISPHAMRIDDLPKVC